MLTPSCLHEYTPYTRAHGGKIIRLCNECIELWDRHDHPAIPCGHLCDSPTTMFFMGRTWLLCAECYESRRTDARMRAQAERVAAMVESPDLPNLIAALEDGLPPR